MNLSFCPFRLHLLWLPTLLVACQTTPDPQLIIFQTNSNAIVVVSFEDLNLVLLDDGSEFIQLRTIRRQILAPDDSFRMLRENAKMSQGAVALSVFDMLHIKSSAPRLAREIRELAKNGNDELVRERAAAIFKAWNSSHELKMEGRTSHGGSIECSMVLEERGT